MERFNRRRYEHCCGRLFHPHTNLAARPFQHRVAGPFNSIALAVDGNRRSRSLFAWCADGVGTLSGICSRYLPLGLCAARSLDLDDRQGSING
jgi:hypothetical protein